MPDRRDIYVDGNLSRSSTGSTRSFGTPDIEANRTYTYKFEIVYEEQGQRVTRTKEISVIRGQQITVALSDFDIKRPYTAPKPNDDEQLTYPLGQ